MLEVLDGTRSGSGAQVSGLATMVANLVIAGSQHEAIEEQWLWLAVRNVLHDGDELADHATAQEQEGKVLLQRLESGTPSDPDYRLATRTIRVRCRSSSRRGVSTSHTSKTWCGPGSPLSQRSRLGTARSAAGRPRRWPPARPHPATPPVGMVQKTVGLGVAVSDRVRDTITGRGASYPPDPQSFSTERPGA
jgi:hypothetical protein